MKVEVSGEIRDYRNEGRERYRLSRHSLVAEHPPCKRKVEGSTPSVGFLFSNSSIIFLYILILI